MIDFRLSNVFNEIENTLKARDVTEIKFEDIGKKNEKVLCVYGRRVGKIKITYPDGFEESISCCNATVSFEYYVKEDENHFDFFIENLINLSESRFKD